MWLKRLAGADRPKRGWAGSKRLGNICAFSGPTCETNWTHLFTLARCPSRCCSKTAVRLPRRMRGWPLRARHLEKLALCCGAVFEALLHKERRPFFAAASRKRCRGYQTDGVSNIVQRQLAVRRYHDSELRCHSCATGISGSWLPFVFPSQGELHCYKAIMHVIPRTLESSNR